MSTQSKPSLVLSVLAALTPMASMPLLLAAAAVASHGQAEELAQRWNEGGWSMYAVLAAAMFVGLISSVLLFFGAYKAGLVAVAALPLTLLAAALGVAGQHLEMEGVLTAIAHANPADRAVIMCGATAEASQPPALGFLAAGALLLALWPGLSLGALARLKDEAPFQRRLLGFAGLGALATGLWCLVAAGRVTAIADAYAAVGHAAPMDRGVLLAAAIEDGASLQPVSLALAVVALALFGAGAAVVRGAPVSALALGVLGVVTLGGGAGLVALSGAARETAEEALAGHTPELLDFPGGAAMDRWSTLELGAQTVSGVSTQSSDEALAERLKERLEQAGVLHEAAGDLEAGGAGARASLALRRDVDAPTLHRVLRLLAAQGVRRVALGGVRTSVPPPRLKIPREYQAVFNAFRATEVQAPLGLGLEVERCQPRCTFATVSERGVSLATEEWPHRSIEPGERPDEEELRPVLVKADPALSPLTLARGAVTAQTHGALLVLVY